MTDSLSKLYSIFAIYLKERSYLGYKIKIIVMRACITCTVCPDQIRAKNRPHARA